MDYKLVFLFIAVLALAQAQRGPKVVKGIGKTAKGSAAAIKAAAAAPAGAVAPSKTAKPAKQARKSGTAVAAGLVKGTAVGVGTVAGAVAGAVSRSITDGAGMAGNIIRNALNGGGLRGKPKRKSKKPKRKLPKLGKLMSIDWNEIGFSYFNGRVFPSGSAQMRKAGKTRGTVAAILKIETYGLQGSAKINLNLRKSVGKGSKSEKNLSMPLCALPSLNRKALMLTLGLRYIALPPQCPVPSGVFNLSYYYKIGGIDFFKGIPPGQYKIDFTITEDENVLLAFFWRVMIKVAKPPGDKPADSGVKPTDKPAVVSPNANDKKYKTKTADKNNKNNKHNTF